MKFKIYSATAKMGGGMLGTLDRWHVVIIADFLDKDKEPTQKYSRLMGRVSRFMQHLMKNEIGVKYELYSIAPTLWDRTNGLSLPNGNYWYGDFYVLFKDNTDEQISYMMYWLTTCKDREFEI